MVQTPWVSSAATHCGAVRKINEDAYLNRSHDGLWVVADGMGGHEAGEVASQMIATCLRGIEVNRPLTDVVDAVEDSLLKVHQDIQNYSRSHCDGRTMGSTVVAFVVQNNIGICLWAGDSRLYRYRDAELSAISEDHSQVNEMLVRGMITPEEALHHPASNVITRAVGASDDLYIDVSLVELKSGDIYLLCSDGLYGALSHQQIQFHLAHDDVSQATTGLIDDSLRAGARDNVTVVAIKVQ